MLTQSTAALSNPLPGEQGMESPCRGWRPVVQDVHAGGLPPGRQCVRLPLLEEHAAGLQELGQDRALQLEGGLEVSLLQGKQSVLYPNTEVCLFKLVHNSDQCSSLRYDTIKKSKIVF